MSPVVRHNSLNRAAATLYPAVGRVLDPNYIDTHLQVKGDLEWPMHAKCKTKTRLLFR